MALCIVAFSSADMQAKSKKTTKKAKTEKIWAALGGYVGNQEIFDMLIISGREYCYVIDGVKRTLKMTRNGNHMVLKAYIRGKYIGTFDGEITYYRWGNEIRVETYVGTFTDEDGNEYSFDLMNCAA